MTPHPMIAALTCSFGPDLFQEPAPILGSRSTTTRPNFPSLAPLAARHLSPCERGRRFGPRAEASSERGSFHGRRYHPHPILRIDLSHQEGFAEKLSFPARRAALAGRRGKGIQNRRGPAPAQGRKMDSLPLTPRQKARREAGNDNAGPYAKASSRERQRATGHENERISPSRCRENERDMAAM
jgi:hypothetical protein